MTCCLFCIAGTRCGDTVSGLGLPKASRSSLGGDSNGRQLLWYSPSALTQHSGSPSRSMPRTIMLTITTELWPKIIELWPAQNRNIWYLQWLYAKNFMINIESYFTGNIMNILFSSKLSSAENMSRVTPYHRTCTFSKVKTGRLLCNLLCLMLV